MLLIAFLMMSVVRYPSGKNVNLQTKTKMRPFVGMLILITLVVFYKEYAALGICLGYVFFGLARHLRRHGRTTGEPPASSRATPPSSV